MKTRLIIAAVATAFALPVLAQTATPSTPKLDQREANQQQRIDKGVQSGALTQKEAAHLQKKEDRLAKHEAKAKADGKVTRQERRRLEREANHVSRDISRKTHNKKTAQ
jgi:hypothetical protein